jgi:UDP-N-acetylmuramate--alanine ligase
MLQLNKNMRIHFIGIGGIGMSAIAQILCEMGYQVSGSDKSLSAITENLIKIGISVFESHSADNIASVDIVVKSSAVTDENPEITEAIRMNIPIVKRAEMLAFVMHDKRNFAVAGSHGKTTTTSILATILKDIGKDPSYAIGGVVPNLGGNAHWSNSNCFVAEADESDGSFLFLNPDYVICTNIDNDHLDYYGNVDNLVLHFKNFIDNVPNSGYAIINADDKNLSKIKSECTGTIYTFGMKKENVKPDYYIKDVHHGKECSTFSLNYKDEEILNCKINLTGIHNIYNCVGAMAAVHQQGHKLIEINKTLDSFKGVKRRAEVVWKNSKTTILDDYAHHPTEIKTTLTNLKQLYGDGLIVIFEPHRYTRTQNFYQEFTECFKDIKDVYFLPIYAASEKEIQGICSENLVKDVNAIGGNAYFLPQSEFYNLIHSSINNVNCIICMGAGPISTNVRNIVNGL